MNRKIINMIFNYCFLTEGAAGEGGGGEGENSISVPLCRLKVTPAALFSGRGEAEERENIEVHQSAGEEGALSGTPSPKVHLGRCSDIDLDGINYPVERLPVRSS